MMRFRLFFLLSLGCALLAGSPATQGKSRTVAYLTLADGFSKEDSAAIHWLQTLPRFACRIAKAGGGITAVRNADVVWVHIPDSAGYQSWTPHMEELKILKTVYDGGGTLLFTDFAALLPHVLGIETVKPEVQTIDISDDWLFDQKGIQGFRGHPVFDGLFGGTFMWDPNVDQHLPRVGYFGNIFPKEGKVVGIEKSYVYVHADNKLMIEYGTGKGKILSIGSFVYFGKENNRRLNLERLMENCLTYLTGDLATGPRTYWMQAKNQPKMFSVRSKPLPRSGQRGLANLSCTELVISRQNPGNNFYDLAGRRALVMGYENGGIDELWVHPFRVVRNFQTGIVSGDSVAWLQNLPVAIDVRPESFARSYKTPYGTLREAIFTSLNGPGTVVHYELEGNTPVQLVIKYRSDLRWMWPYDERALGDVYYGFDEELGALHVKDTSGDFYCVIGCDVKPLKHLSGQYGDVLWKSGDLSGTPTDANQVYHASVYELDREHDNVLNVAIVGTDEGAKSALKEYGILLQRPRDLYEELVKHYTQLLETRLTIASPDKEFNTLFKWALVGTDRFLTTTPRLGTALVAGFATTARGWDGGHKINGRPGYAWYFGRDSEWSSFAIDDYGDFGTVRKQLEFLQKYQDLSGKIFHELSTSGVVHYDAADATPLYVILAAHYLRASGDASFITRSWPHLKKAMDFLYSTDTDGDLLIENTNVGHGWVEGGKLWPVHTEFYLAGLWAQALKDASFIASHLGKKGLSDKYGSDAEKVRRILNTDFWTPENRFFSYGKKKDGTYNREPTVLPAAVAYYGLLDREKAEFMVDQYGGNWFSSDWGVRIVTSVSPLFNPQGYHYGAVWPLFTGWVALAEYEYGNSTQGFTHITNNLYIKNHWALGYVEEVMHGTAYKPSGVCPHQCWSETNILHPAITGMVGWKPDATRNSARLAPRFPVHWDTVTVNNLHVGSSVVRFRMERTSNTTRYYFHLLKGSGVTVSFAPEIPEGMEINDARLDGMKLNRTYSTDNGLLTQPIEFPLRRTAEVLFSHTKGVGMIPMMPRPEPGDSSAGYRIAHTSLRDGLYTIDVEGKPGTTGTFDVRIFDQGIVSVKGAQFAGSRTKGIARLKVPFELLRAPFVRQQVTLRIQER